jgi:hypothetical protein
MVVSKLDPRLYNFLLNLTGFIVLLYTYISAYCYTSKYTYI